MGFFDKLFKRPPESAMHLKRNDKCWCGSDKKYKKCHYSSDKKYFDAKIMSNTCNTSG